MQKKTKLENGGSPSASSSDISSEEQGFAKTSLEADEGGARTTREDFGARTAREDSPDFAGTSGSGWLPPELAKRFHIKHEFDALGTEADAFLVENENGDIFFAKIYRKGIKPNSELLEGIQQGDKEHLVEIFQFGESGGRWFELLEYIENGSLRDLIKREGPALGQARVHKILRELAEALSFIHGESLQIEHRDLKPENILVRTTDPLDLVLTDFGIASILSETVHFTSANRTLAYAPPEAVSGSVFRTAWDHWSLGIIIVELLTGKHPFEGLSDQIIQSNLATQPVDEFVEGVNDPAWRKLCRGLLRRDPKKRWGTEEILLWLDEPNASSLIVLEEAIETGALANVRPFPFRGEKYTTPSALGTALAKHWDDARREWQSGRILRWVKEDLRDFELERQLEEIDLLPGADLDNQLFRAIHVLNPAGPLSFGGMELTRQNLVDLANKSVGSILSRNIFLALHDSRILETAGQISPSFPKELLTIDLKWQQALADYSALRRTLLDRAGDRGVVSSLIPDLSDKSDPLSDKSDPTVEEKEKKALLLAASVPDNKVIAGLRAQADEAASAKARECSWFAKLGDPQTASPAHLMMIIALAGHAEEEAEKAREVRRREIEQEKKAAEHQRLVEAEQKKERRRDILYALVLAVLMTPPVALIVMLVGVPFLAVAQFVGWILGWSSSAIDSFFVGASRVVMVITPFLIFYFAQKEGYQEFVEEYFKKDALTNGKNFLVFGLYIVFFISIVGYILSGG